MSGDGKDNVRVRSPIPTEALRLVLELLSPNDLALAGRLSCRDAAGWFSSARCRTAWFSQPLPLHAVESFQLYARRCMPLMTRNQKLRGLLSAAASGSEVNTVALWALIRPGLFPEPQPPNFLAGATLDFDYSVSTAKGDDPGWVACKHGHPQLVGWMLQNGWALDPVVTLEAAARFCDLAALKQIWKRLRHERQAQLYLYQALATDAAASSTPDALDKVQWVLDKAGDELLPATNLVAAAIAGASGISRRASSSSSSSNAGCGGGVSGGGRGDGDSGGGGGSGGSRAWGSSNGSDGDAGGGDCGGGHNEDEVFRRLEWLRGRGFPLGGGEVLAAALQHTSLAVAEWLLADAAARRQQQQQQQQRPGSQGTMGNMQRELSHHFYGLLPLARGALRATDSLAKLRWLREHELLQTDGVLEDAALYGNLDAVQYLYEQCECRLTEGAFSSAVEADSLPTAAWLLQAGCPLPPADARHVNFCVYVKAAGRGSLGMVQWLLEQARCPLVYDTALLKPFVEVWVSPVHGILGPGGLEDRPMGHGAGGGGGGGAGDAGPGEEASGSTGGSGGGGEGVGGDGKLLSAVQLLMRRRLQGGAGRHRVSRQAGDLRLVQALHATGECPLEVDVLSAAAESGCEALVEWLVGAGCDMVVVRKGDENPYMAAAEQGDLAMMRALRRLGVPWGKGLLYQAVASGLPYSVLRWLRGQGLAAEAGEAHMALECFEAEEDEAEELSDEDGDSEEESEDDSEQEEEKEWLREWLWELADGDNLKS